MEDDPLNKPRSHHLQRKIDARKPGAKLDQNVEEQFTSGRLLGKFLSTRPIPGIRNQFQTWCSYKFLEPKC